MHLPLSWLKDYLDLKEPVEELAKLLTLAGLEVDGVKPTPLAFSGVVIAEVRSVAPHPNADQLKQATVFDGKELLTIVCGAPNCRSEMKVALAKIGARLTDEKGRSYAIKKATLRGIASQGMLCSEKELGLSENGEDILSINSPLKAGTPLEELYGDLVFDISLTPNLGHCMSVLGIARELSALLNRPINEHPFSLEEDPAFPIDKAIKISSLDPTCALSYSCRLIRNAKIAPSPDYLQKRLKSAGLRSVNNVVDVTNYIALDLGQPLHAFDYARLKEKELLVARANAPLSLKLLDGKTYNIPAQTPLIYAGKEPIAVAGVMGSADSEITASSCDILLEAAHFDPSSVRKSSKALGIRSEASTRFERGIDPKQVVAALDRAAALIAKLTGGSLAKGHLVKTEKPWKLRTLDCSTLKANRLLGTRLSPTEVEAIFCRLKMNPKSLDQDRFRVDIPSYRNDLLLEIDLIEEIARLFGYNNIPKSCVKTPLSLLPHSPLFLLENKIRGKLVSEGLQEFLTCNLISPKAQQHFAETSLSAKDAIAVMHPSSVEQSTLRTSLLSSLLPSVKTNANTKQFSLALFEIGRIHFKGENEWKERPMVALLLTGKSRPDHWKEKPRAVDFFDLKGYVENLLDTLGIANSSFSPAHLSSLHPKKQAHINTLSLTLGALGQVSPQKLLKLGIKEPVFFAELDLLDLLDAMKPNLQMTPLPLYPESERDWTLTLPPNLSVGAILDAINLSRSKLLKNVSVWDLYEEKNVTLRFTYRSDRASLKHAQVEKEHNRIVTSVTTTFSI